MTYVEAVLADLRQDLAQFQTALADRPIYTVFIGGGTPSLFSPEAFETLFQGLETCLPFSRKIEITLEANPGTLEHTNFTDLHHVGINRLSLGIQSFDDRKLKRLGRIHDSEEALKAIVAAKRAGFDNLNLDVMFGLPEQNCEEALSDLKQALEQGPSHFSWYQLTLEPNTLFHRYPPALPNDEITWQIQQQGQAMLAALGYAQYEVSAYSQASKQCKHNLNYWRFGDYLGIGAGAHGKITDPKTGLIHRTWKKKHPTDYLKAHQQKEIFLGAPTQVVAKEEIAFEFMLNAARLNAPISFALFTERTGLSIQDIKPHLEQAEKQGLIVITPTEIIKTSLGERFVNNLIELFL